MGKYDKLIKENLSHIVIPLIKRLGIDLKGKRLECSPNCTLYR